MLENIWQTRFLSNDGAYHDALEKALCEYLGVDHLCLVANATMGLMLALRQLDIEGEVITTPFTFVGTTHALRLCGLTPVFVDIDPETLNIDPSRIEAAITPRTRAIMPVHIFGRSCDTASINAIAQKHGLHVIYDAAHAFGVQDDGGSILRHGDMSVLSFHATKVFNTFEGGAVICKDAKTKNDIDRLRNFGIVDEVTVCDVGMNAKMNEFSAALGLAQLKHIDNFILQRGQVDARYRELLQTADGIHVLRASETQNTNYYHFPMLIGDDAPYTRDTLYDWLSAHNVYARRYFYPLVSELKLYSSLPSANSGNLPQALKVASQILCLPLYPDLEAHEQQRISDLIGRCEPA